MQHQAPRRRRFLHPETEEGQRRFGEDGLTEERGGDIGEFDAFDSASVDGEDGIAGNLVNLLLAQGNRRAVIGPFLDNMVVIINTTLAAGAQVTIDGFGTFDTEITAEGILQATFETDLGLGLELIITERDRILDSINLENLRQDFGRCFQELIVEPTARRRDRR